MRLGEPDPVQHQYERGRAPTVPRDRGESDQPTKSDFQRRSRRMALTAAMLMSLVPGAVAATENSGAGKALGVDTIAIGIMPPPGMRLYTYLTYYEAHELLDGSGNPRRGVSNFDQNATALFFRFQYVWPEAKLWDANIATRVGVTANVDVNLKFDVDTPGGKIHRSGSASESFPGVLLAPVLLGWHSQTVHQIAGVQFFLPTRKYDKNQFVNASSGYSSVAPTYWVTWLPIDQVEVDASFFWFYNWKNGETNYKSGQEFDLDYAVGYSVTPAWQIGINGYAFKQLTSDEVNGNPVPGGNKGQVVSIGPYVRYSPSRDWGLAFKWQREYLVENRPSGNRFFLQLMLKLW